ncbi:MAG TPA: alpha/beta hydrolase-fold protein [Byssovorax sp.]|jgi:predicted alpha/beta superfamily hydrolase
MPPRSPTPGAFHDLGAFPSAGVAARRVRAYVPRGADVRIARPILYLFDGQNVFGDAGSFAGGWHAHEAADKLTVGKTTVAPVVVAIDHGHEKRIDELGPFRAKQHGGGTDDLLDWMIGVLDPLVRSRFAIVPGAVGAAVGGSSMGGLAALYAHFRNPHTFGGALCLSPSLWFADRAIFRAVASRPRPDVSRVYLDCGGREAGGRMLALAAGMANDLRARGYAERQLMWRPDPRGQHDEAAWRRRLPKALRFMFAV